MKWIALLAMSGSLAWAQMRIVPHLTRANGGFETVILISNLVNDTQTYRIRPYLENGTGLPIVSGQVVPGAILRMMPSQLFGAMDVSHFVIEGDGDVNITLAYRDAKQQYSAAHVPINEQQAERFRIFPGELTDVADGLAVVNTSDSPLNVRIRQLNLAGDVLAEASLTSEPLDPMAKALYLFNDDFAHQEGSYFELDAGGDMAVVALRFALDGAPYFWQTAAIPMAPLPGPEMVGWVAVLEPHFHGVSGMVTIVDERTLRLDSFNYDGLGPDVYVYVAQDRDFINGMAVTPELRSTPYNNETVLITLPGNVTLADFNSVSIWCRQFSSDFGSGVFAPP